MSASDDPLRARREIWRGSIGSFGLDEVTLPNGHIHELAVLRHPGAAAALPFVDRDHIVLVRQYRYAAGGTLWEAPAGKLDAGEAPQVCIARELREETGYRAARFIPLGQTVTAPGFCDEVIHLYAALELSAGTTELEASEIIEPVQIPFARALQMADEGEITDAKTLCALYRASRHPELAPPAGGGSG